MSPDKQLNILKDMWRKEKNIEIIISKEDNETIAYYLNEVRYFDITLFFSEDHKVLYFFLVRFIKRLGSVILYAEPYGNISN